MRCDEGNLPIRLTVLQPVQGVAVAIQIGRSELLPPSHADSFRLTFDFTVRTDATRGAQPRFLGPAVQGPPAARFVYVNSGKQAGQTTSCWDRRAKVPLTGITWATIDELYRVPSGRVEACIAGVARDGGPVCATVPLLEGGWRVTAT